MTTLDSIVSVHGESFRIARMTPPGTGKFFGKRTFTLVRLSDNALFTAYGKTVSGNSKLTPKN